MEDMSQWGAAKVNAVCSRCHRSIDDISLDGDDAVLTGRFQGYGLELSRCYKKSGGRLSCVTCHDPHTSVSTDRRYYEKICLTCHTPSATGQSKACPVNPKELCIGCHMPKRPIIPEPRTPILMADHLIQAYRTKKGIVNVGRGSLSSRQSPRSTHGSGSAQGPFASPSDHRASGR